MLTFEIRPLSVIIVHYGKDEHLFECLHSLSINRPVGSLEVVVVNNTTQRIGDRLEVFPFVKEVFVGKNIGFGAAGNIGAKIAKGEILFFLNPDTKLLRADMFERVLSRIQDTREKISIVGVGLITQKYEHESWSGGRATRLMDIILKRLFFFQEGLFSWSGGKSSFVDWVSGAAFCVRKEDFLRLEGFDESFFLYFEDMDLCLRAKKIFGGVYYDGSIKVLHYGGKSFSAKKIQKKHYFTSQKKYFQKHRSAFESKIFTWLQGIFLKNV